MTINGEYGDSGEARSVVLRSIPKLREWVDLGPGGALRFQGQDLDVAELFPGAEEYEWCFTVAVPDFPALLAALGEPDGTPVLEAVARHTEFLAGQSLSEWFPANGIPFDFWFRHG